MCDPNGKNYGIINPTGKLLGSKYEVADPLAYNGEQLFKSPVIPPPPPPPQEMKMPDSLPALRSARKPTGNRTILNGASGITTNSLNTGGTFLGSLRQ